MYHDYIPPGCTHHPLNTGRSSDILVLEDGDLGNMTFEHLVFNVPTTDSPDGTLYWLIFEKEPKRMHPFTKSALNELWKSEQKNGS